MWGFSKIDLQEKIHLKFCKKLLGVKRTTQNDFVYGELGRVTLQVNIFQSIIKYWLKILECENSKYIKYAYELILSDLQRKPNTVHWASKVKDLLSSMGFYEVWLAQGVASRKHVRVMKTPLHPTLYRKTGVYRGILFFLFLL